MWIHRFLKNRYSSADLMNWQRTTQNELKLGINNKTCIRIDEGLKQYVWLTEILMHIDIVIMLRRHDAAYLDSPTRNGPKSRS